MSYAVSPSFGGGWGEVFIKQFYTCFQCAQERFFLFFNHFFNQGFLRNKFWISFTHYIAQRIYQLIHKCRTLTKESISITYSTTQNSTNYITRFGIRWQLTIGNRKCNGTYMISNNAHSDIRFIVFTIFCSANFANFCYNRCKYISIVIGLHALHSHTKSFEAHTCINYFSWKSFERSIGFSVVLHKYIIPNFNHLWVTSIHQRQTVYFCTIIVITNIDMYFRTWTTRTRIAHFPKIIFFIAVNNTVFWQELFPNSSRFIITV